MRLFTCTALCVACLGIGYWAGGSKRSQPEVRGTITSTPEPVRSEPPETPSGPNAVGRKSDSAIKAAVAQEQTRAANNRKEEFLEMEAFKRHATYSDMLSDLGLSPTQINTVEDKPQGKVGDSDFRVFCGSPFSAPADESTLAFRDSAFVDDVAKTSLAAILQQHGLQNIRTL